MLAPRSSSAGLVTAAGYPVRRVQRPLARCRFALLLAERYQLRRYAAAEGGIRLRGRRSTTAGTVLAQMQSGLARASSLTLNFDGKQAVVRVGNINAL